MFEPLMGAVEIVMHSFTGAGGARSTPGVCLVYKVSVSLFINVRVKYLKH